MQFFVVSTLLLAASCSASLYGAVSTQYLSQDGHGQYTYGYAEPNSQKHETKTGDVVHGGYSYVDGNGLVQSVKYTSDPIHGFQVAATNLPKGPEAPVHAIVPAHYAPAPISYIAPISYHAAPVSYASTYSAPHQYASVAYGNGWAAPAHGLPQQVQDTPEVAAAKVAHFAAHAQARANLHHLKKRSVWGYAPSSWSQAAAAPAIHNGVPVETPEVQQAKAEHFAAHAAAAHGSAYAPAHYASAPAYYSAPVIHNGVPVDTPEVQHAKAAHFAAVAEAQARSHSAPSHYQEPAQYAPAHHSGAYHIPIIQNGVPVETPEVQHAKAAHFAAVAEAQSRSGYGHGQESYSNDNSWDDGNNSWDNGHRDW